jgi:diadenosine tetraphosphatase ApaH/serine/threonine PP2A family protein phosphatase
MEEDFDVALETACKDLRNGRAPRVQTCVDIITKAKEIFQRESNVLELSDPITICGDIHGQLYDLFQLFDAAGPDTQSFLFLGDYVDRGGFSIETLLYLLIKKIRSPDNFFMLRGNHESRAVSQHYGFYGECCRFRGCDCLFLMCNELFDLMPLAAVISDRVFAVHGGLSPSMDTIGDIMMVDRVDEVPSKGLIADLLWSDPEERSTFGDNRRGSGHVFGKTQVARFCQVNGNLDFVVRSHQLVQAGFQWWFNDQLITVWSAPNYEYRSGNRACVMAYTKNDGKKSRLRFFAAMPEARRKPPPTICQGYFT